MASAGSGKWTVAQMPDLSGRKAIVTGANSGIGFYTAQALARANADVTLAVRDLDKGEQAIEAMGPNVRRPRVRRLDLADLASVRDFASAWTQDCGPSLDLLINNAGIMAIPRRLSRDGFELQFATNHLGHFALTGLMLPALVAVPNSRIVTVSSGAHRMVKGVDFDDLMGERNYWSWRIYGQSKLANLLFSAELDRRLSRIDSSIVVAAAHPGYAATNLQGVSSQMRGARLENSVISLGNRILAQSAAMGALPTLFAATSPAVKSGSYVGPDGFAEMRGYPTFVGRSAAAKDSTQAERLWTVSEELTGVRFPFDE